MSNVQAVTNETWATEVLESPVPVLVDFWAEWCVPCRMVSPVVEEIADEHAGKLGVAKVDVDTNPELTRQYGIMSIPTIMLFAGGEERKRIVGAKSKSQILAEIQDALP
jgi:thioredoxin 1